MIYSLFGFQYALAPPHSAFTPRVASSRAASRAAAVFANTPAGGDENLAAPPAIEQLENMFALESTAETTPALEELDGVVEGLLSEEFDDEEEDAAEVEELDPDRPPIESFGLTDRVVATLKDKGITHFTPIQARSYELLKEGSDMLGRSRTGTGKTLAFSLPLIEKLAAEEPRGRGRPPRMLVLAPTRELAKQVAGTLEYLGKCYGLEVATFHGGVAYPPQQRALRNGIDVLVGTPGRIIDHLSEGKLDLSEVGYAVLDEADEMLNMGFKEDVETILQVTARPPPPDHPPSSSPAPRRAMRSDALTLPPPLQATPDRESGLRQTVLFSATHPPWVKQVGPTPAHPPPLPPPPRPGAHPIPPSSLRWRASTRTTRSPSTSSAAASPKRRTPSSTVPFSRRCPSPVASARWPT